MKTKKIFWIGFPTAIVFTFLTVGLVSAQTDGLSLRLSKVFGYSSLSSREFQGTMSLEARGPEDLQRVVFFIDGEEMAEANAAPFKIQFVTDTYGLGEHNVSATGFTRGGNELRSNDIAVEFVTAERGMQVGMKILIPILGIALAAMLISVFIPALMNRGKNVDLPPGTPRNYGLVGGTVCPRCSRPYAMHLFGFNLVVGKLDRCPYCGKWALARRWPLDALRAAEAAELERAQESGQVPPPSEEERLRKELENSRYHDL